MPIRPSFGTVETDELARITRFLDDAKSGLPNVLVFLSWLVDFQQVHGNPDAAKAGNLPQALAQRILISPRERSQMRSLATETPSSRHRVARVVPLSRPLIAANWSHV